VQLKAEGSATEDWYEVGPLNKPNLGLNNIGQGSEPGIGPIRFLTMKSDQPDTMFCGSIGGLFYTYDAGLNWANAGSDAWEISSCKDAVFNVTDHYIWYAVNNGFWGYAGGIRRTTDAGMHWEIIADLSDFYHAGVWTQVNKLLTDPNDQNILYAASADRLWRTLNANSTNPIWSEVTIPIPSTISNDPIYGTYPFTDNRYVYDLEMKPNDSQTLYASVRYEAIVSETDKVHY
jgi:hypothetical protein